MRELFFVFSPDGLSSATPQVIYEQGGGSNGMSIYRITDTLYFYMYFIATVDYSPWGLKNNSSSASNSG